MTPAPRPTTRRRDPVNAPTSVAQQPAAVPQQLAAVPQQLAAVPQQPAAVPQQPAALLHSPGQRIVHGNAPFVAEFGSAAVGLPAREALPDLPATAFQVVDRVLAAGRPLACWLTVAGERRRLTVAPRRDPESGEIYGVALRLAHEANTA